MADSHAVDNPHGSPRGLVKVTFPAPTSALLTLPLEPGREGIARVLAAERLVSSTLPGIRATVPAFNRLLVEGEPDMWNEEDVRDRLLAIASTALVDPPSLPDAEVVELPVCYEPELAPDLTLVAEHAGLTPNEVVRRHCTATYTVLATGFAPGFAYLGDVDPRLAMPRRGSPRSEVPQGAVGIADRRTGVYPTTSPGGWRLIGRVPPQLFSDPRVRMRRFTPGGLVRFRPLARKDFDNFDSCCGDEHG